MIPNVIKNGFYSLCNSLRVRCFTTSAHHNSENLNVHRDSHSNNAKMPFRLTSENFKRLMAVVANYPEGYQRSALGAMVDLAQRQHGWVPISAMHEIASTLHIPRMRVYEYVTFYSMIKRSFRGKYHVKVCTCTPCWLMGSDEILKAVEDATCCAAGEVSADGMFGVDSVECQGACVNAPLMSIDDDYYEDLTCQSVHEIIKTIKDGGIPTAGPQSGRTSCEPITGETTLSTYPPGPGFMIQSALTPGIGQ